MLNRPPHPRDLVIDTGPLSVLLIGYYDIEKLDAFSMGLKKFGKSDFVFLVQFLRNSSIFVTPQILAEAGNILENFVGKASFEKFMKFNLELLKNRISEIYIRKNEILESNVVLRFGISDTSVFLSSKNKAVLTTDWALKNVCEKNNIAAFHLDEITGLKWLVK